MNNSIAAETIALPKLSTLLWRGFRQKCPRCGETRLFASFLKTPESCGTCHHELGAIRADDFPPYLTMFIVGHIIVRMILIVEKSSPMSISMNLKIWLPLTAVLTFWFLPRIKGLIVGLMMHIGLRGDETQ